LQTFSAKVSEREPPKTVKSWENRKISRDALPSHAEIAAAVRDEGVQLLEGAGVEQRFDTLPGRQLSGLVLLFYPFLAAPFTGLGVASPHLLQSTFLHKLLLPLVQFLPVGEEFCLAAVSEGVLQKLPHDIERDGGDISPRQGGFHDMQGMADGGSQDLGTETVVVVDHPDLPNKVHTIV